MFAQLTVGGKWEGPHVFVVRLRDDQGQLVQGVRIKDNGPKAGLNGVDNGQIWCAATHHTPDCAPCQQTALAAAHAVAHSTGPAYTGCLHRGVVMCSSALMLPDRVLRASE